MFSANFWYWGAIAPMANRLVQCTSCILPSETLHLGQLPTRTIANRTSVTQRRSKEAGGSGWNLLHGSKFFIKALASAEIFSRGEQSRQTADDAYIVGEIYTL